MIAPSSYPVFGAEAIVNIKLLKAMTNSNEFEVDLISKKNKWSDYPSNTLEDLGVKVKTLNIEEVDNSLSLETLWLHIKSLIIFGSVFKGSHWAVKALPKILSLISENKYDYVLTKNAPSFLLGYYIKQKFGIKWLATWNDPYPIIKYPSPYGRGCDAKLNLLDKFQLRIMRFADMHIFPSERLKEYMLKYLGISKKQTIIIPHVVNNISIQRLNILKTAKQLKLIHSGNILPPRNPHNLIQAINQLDERILKNLSITILGVNSADSFKETNQTGNTFKFLPPVTYTDSIAALKDYHIAIILEAPCEEGIFLPTKVSDFMQSGIPIWAISPQNGVLNDLYKNGYIPYFSNISDVKSIKDTLITIYNDFKLNCIQQNVVPNDYLENNIVKQYKSF